MVIDKDKEYQVAEEYRGETENKVSHRRTECGQPFRRKPAEGAACEMDVHRSGRVDSG